MARKIVDDISSSKLLSCPFCGGEAHMTITEVGDTTTGVGWVVQCGNFNCPAGQQVQYWNNEKTALLFWNMREGSDGA